MSSKTKTTDLMPMKQKTPPDFHWCYVCKEWFYMSIEDFPAFGHYSKNDYQDHLVKQGIEGKKLISKVLAGAPHTSRPVLIKGKTF